MWGNGNPSFIITVTGMDLNGDQHTYQKIVEFTKGSCTVGADGYATVGATFENIPIGTYKVYEESAFGYYLSGCYTTSGNVVVTNVSSPTYGKKPVDIAYATITLGTLLDGNVTFVNTRTRYDIYGHTDHVENIIPIR